MDSDEMASMYAQILNGIPKEKSRFVTDDESSALWDQIAAGIDRISAENPNAQFSVPNEVPRADDDGDADPGAETPAEDAPEGEPPPGTDAPDAPEAAPSGSTTQQGTSTQGGAPTPPENPQEQP